jgi:hypothetical protein
MITTIFRTSEVSLFWKLKLCLRSHEEGGEAHTPLGLLGRANPNYEIKDTNKERLPRFKSKDENKSS